MKTMRWRTSYEEANPRRSVLCSGSWVRVWYLLRLLLMSILMSICFESSVTWDFIKRLAFLCFFLVLAIGSYGQYLEDQISARKFVLETCGS